MTSHSLLLSTCISCVIAFGGDGEGRKTLENAFRSIDTHSVVSLRNAMVTVAPDSTQTKPGMASARKDSEALRRQASSEYDVTRTYAEGALIAAQERCDAQGAQASDSCMDDARNAYEDTLASAGERLAESKRELASLAR
jgi:hypothetical protein